MSNNIPIFCVPDIQEFDYGAIHHQALPLYGHPHTIERGETNYPEVTQYCIENFEYVSDSEEAIMVYPMSFFSPTEAIERNEDIQSRMQPNEIFEDFEKIFYEKYKHRNIYGFSYNTYDEDLGYNDINSYQTHLNKSKRTNKQFPLPAFFKDVFNDNYLNDSISIGWCGAKHFGREGVLNKFKELKFNNNFIIRERGKTGTNSVEERNTFYNNLEENIFSICIRGGANFCWRFYETLMMGRIPILIESDRCFIFEDYEVNINDVCVLVSSENTIKEIEDKIDNFISNNNLLEIQKHNRWVWEEYCSPIGFIKKFKNRVGY